MFTIVVDTFSVYVCVCMVSKGHISDFFWTLAL